jgi:tetratricopeptide (TPR) repeat protein
MGEMTGDSADHPIHIMKKKAVILFIGLLTLCVGCAEDKELIRQKARAQEAMAHSYIQKGDLKTGTKYLIEAAKLDPENPDIQYELAIAYKELRVYDRSLVHFKKTLALKPEFSAAWNNLGTLYLLMEQWDSAIDSFRKALRDITYKRAYFAYNNMGLAYYNKGDYQEAIDSFQQAIGLLPSYSVCYGNLGLAYEAVNNWEGAVGAYQKAIYHDPEYATAHFFLGRLYIRLNRYDEASEALRKTVEIDPTGPFAEDAKRLLKR